MELLQIYPNQPTQQALYQQFLCIIAEAFLLIALTFVPALFKENQILLE
jgi:hypothetical protein